MLLNTWLMTFKNSKVMKVKETEHLLHIERY